MTSLKVNETDYEWEKIKNHISGVWNSSTYKSTSEHTTQRVHELCLNIKERTQTSTMIEI